MLSHAEKPKTTPEWITTAIDIRNYHISRKKENSSHRIADTAKLLKKSVGYINQQITIASWLRSHREMLEKCSGCTEAIEVIRSKKHQLLIEEED